MNIPLSSISTTLGTRKMGQEIRASVEAAIDNGEKIVLDFHDISSISHSFADECFGKLLLRWDLEKVKKHTTFKNTTPIISSIILSAINDRILTPA